MGSPTFSTLSLKSVTREDFVTFWSRRYPDQDEARYAENMKRPLTRKRAQNLFRWKNGSTLSGRKQASVNNNFFNRMKELKQFCDEFEPQTFLNHFSGSGPIWRIFFLHIHSPERFPIFDQHTYRAMRYIKNEGIAELPVDPGQIIEIYLNKYCEFYQSFGQSTNREVDKALWVFGKFLKSRYNPISEALDCSGSAKKS
jgi:hypothetical protein